MEEISRKLQRIIRDRAESYTPEWRFDPEYPDIGSALAAVYAQMMAGTLKRRARLPLKYRVAFLNELNAGLLPAVPSSGYATFSLINEEAKGVLVPAGTAVTADVEAVPSESAGTADAENILLESAGAEDAEGISLEGAGASDTEIMPERQVRFETREEIYVTPAMVTSLYQACDRSDTIYELYRRERGDWQPVSLFASGQENLQSHEMYFSHDTILNIQSQGSIALGIHTHSGLSVGKSYLEKLADPDKAVFEYSSKQGWTPFASCGLEGDRIIFQKSGSLPGFARREVAGRDSFWIRCRILDYSSLAKMDFQTVRLCSGNDEMLPDTVYGDQKECGLHEFLPFGERLSLYQEVYFGSEEVLSKRGAQIAFSFRVDFKKIPLNEKEPVNWEWIMKQGDVRPEQEFDIDIESVIWEYYNGAGWTRLFPDDSYCRVFSPPANGKGQYYTIRFSCPPDMEKTLVNAVETYYIRARAMKINHLYKMTGSHIIPLVRNVSFRYAYQEEGQEAQNYVFFNNLEYQCREGGGEKGDLPYAPLMQTGLEGVGIYFGFQIPPVGSPVRMLFRIAGDEDRSARHLTWEYWNGCHWRNLSLEDGTGHFSRTGIIAFMGNSDMAKRSMFGREEYWIRIREEVDAYGEQKPAAEPPVLQEIHMNTVKIQNVNRREREYFQMEVYQENQYFELQQGNIYEAAVYVEEQGDWKKWSRVQDFLESGPADRHYVMQPVEGRLVFGNGKQGRIPPPSRKENIRIDYCSGGGAHTNLARGRIDRMELSMGYISQVTNPEATAGGCDAETREEAVQRSSAAIRHQDRAVSPRDYEELALCAVRDIRMVKCFAGFDGQGNDMRGAVTLVVLPREFREGQMAFVPVKEKIMEYLRGRISAVLWDNRRLFVVPPVLTEIRLRMEVGVENLNQSVRVKGEILERLERFLDPVGWQIGSFPNRMQIQNALCDISGIVHIPRIVMSTYVVNGAERREIDGEEAKACRYLLPVNGAHDVLFHII